MSSITHAAVDYFGEDCQIIKAIEEMSELTHALTRYLNGEMYAANVAEEMADVFIMMEQLRYIFDNSESVKRWMAFKLRRLKERINKEVADEHPEQ